MQSQVTGASRFASAFALIFSCYECTSSVGSLFLNPIILCQKLTLSPYNLIVASVVVAKVSIYDCQGQGTQTLQCPNPFQAPRYYSSLLPKLQIDIDRRKRHENENLSRKRNSSHEEVKVSQSTVLKNVIPELAGRSWSLSSQLLQLEAEPSLV